MTSYSYSSKSAPWVLIFLARKGSSGWIAPPGSRETALLSSNWLAAGYVFVLRRNFVSAFTFATPLWVLLCAISLVRDLIRPLSDHSCLSLGRPLSRFPLGARRKRVVGVFCEAVPDDANCFDFGRGSVLQPVQVLR